MNRLIFVIFVLLSLNIYAYSDFDMDGVEDKVDICPNTPLSDLVDINGCTIKSLQSPHSFDIILGVNFSQTNYENLEKTDTLTQTLQVDYYYKNFSFQASSGYYTSESSTYANSGMNDSFLGFYYKFKPTNTLNLRVGAGVLLPTYDAPLNNNNTDYTASLSMSYLANNISFFGGIAYTLINDDDQIITYDDGSYTDVQYQDTFSYNFGIGIYPTPKLYVSTSYSVVDSIYKGSQTIDTASLYAFYNINSRYFTSLNYSYGLSDLASDNYLSVRFGYYF